VLLAITAGSLVAGGMAPAGAQQQFTSAELDELLSPIALFPDPLLAQLLPAATFVDQIDEAARVLAGRTDAQTIDAQPWDVSVKALAHYPDVLGRMAQHPDWTVALGQAYVAQPEDVMASIQRLRVQAHEVGNLVSTEQQTVTVESPTVIEIVPAQPEYIYVPDYDDDVYWDAGAAAITFGAGLLMGAWMNNAIRWGGGGIYYHGWAGGGWIGASRPHVDLRNNAYVNQRFNQINIDRGIANRDVGDFRSQLQRGGEARAGRQPARQPGREPAGARRPETRPAPIDAARRTDGGVRDTRSDALRSRQHSAQRLESYRGRQPEAGVRQPRQMPARPDFQRTVPGARPAPQVSRRPSTPRQSAFGGARSGATARAHSARGSRSMGGMRGGGMRGGGRRR
jgi:hypothetical protein